MLRRCVGPALVVVIIIVSVIGLGVVVTADSNYTVSVSPAVDVPDRTVTFEGQDYTVSAIGRVRIGAEISVSVDAPSGEQYNIHLYNGDRQIADSERATGDATRSFPTDYLDPGSYMVAIEHDGTFKTVHPVVLPAYTATLEAPTTVTNGETIHVASNVTQVQSGKTIERVETVVANEKTNRHVEMSSDGSGTYETNVSTDDLPTGEYQVYIVVRGTKTVEGEKELIGLSDSQSLTIEPNATPTSTPTATQTTTITPTSTTNSGRTTQTSPESTSTTTDGPTTTTTPTQIVTTTSSTPITTSTPRTTDHPQATASPTDVHTTTTSLEQVIQPNTTRTRATQAGETTRTVGSQLGAFPLLWISTLLLLFLVRIRS